MAHDAFQVAAPSAAAVILFRVEGNNRVAAFPRTFRVGIPSKADTIADRPDADEAVELTARCRESSGCCVGVIENADAAVNAARF